MADRTTDPLERLLATATEAKVEILQHPAAVPPPPVDVNYPEPTWHSAVLRDVSRWSGHSFVMEPSINTKIQIFAPRKMGIDEAYDLFLASLSVINLRAVQVGKVVKFVPITLVVSA